MKSEYILYMNKYIDYASNQICNIVMIVKTVHRFFYLPFNHYQKQKHFPWVDTHTAHMKLCMQFHVRVSTIKWGSTQLLSYMDSMSFNYLFFE